MWPKLLAAAVDAAAYWLAERVASWVRGKLRRHVKRHAKRQQKRWRCAKGRYNGHYR